MAQTKRGFITLTDISDGTQGQSIRTVNIYKKNDETLTSTTGGTFVNPLTDNTDWSLNVPSLTADEDKVYVATRTFTNDAASPQDANWSTPTVYSERIDGEDSTVAGQSVRTVNLYKKNDETLSSTTGGTFASPNADNTDWSLSVPALTTNGDKVYVATRTFSDDAASPQDSAWSTPTIYSQRTDGSAGQSGRTVNIYKKNDDTLTSTTAGTFASPIAGNTDWSLNVPALTDDEDKVYVATRTFTSDGASPQDASWSATSVYSERIDGEDSTVAGQSIRTVNIYKKNDDTLTSTTGGTFASPLTNNTDWSLNVPALTTNGDKVYVATRTFTDDAASPQDSSWSATAVYSQRTDGSAGQSVRTVNLYKKNDETLSSTTGGTFAAPTTGNSDWSLSVPSLTDDEDKVYVATRTFTSDGASPQDASWSTPTVYSERIDGTDSTVAGQSVRTVNLYRKNSNTISSSSGTFASPTTGNTDWSLSVPALTTNLDKVYVATRTFTDDAASPQDANWSTPTVYSERIDGEAGAPGSFVITAYRNLEATPAIPVGGTEILSPNDWSYVATDTDLQRWKSNARFGDGITATSQEISEITFAPGSETGSTSETPAVAEVTEIEITGTQSAPGAAAGEAEETSITFTGESGDSSLSGGFDLGSTGTTALLRDADFGNGFYTVVGGGGTILTTKDPSTGIWNLNGSSNLAGTLRGVAFGNGVWVTVGTGSNRVFTATDPTGTWSGPQTAATTNSHLGLGFGDGKFVAVSSAGTIMSSTDGVSWEPETVPSGNATLLGVGFGNGLFVVVGQGGRIITSPAGTTPGNMVWTNRTSGVGTLAQLIRVAFGEDDAGNDLWVAVGGTSNAAGNVTTSVDGLSWTSRSTTDSGVNKDLTGIAHLGGGEWLASSKANRHITSSDGTTWTTAFAGWGLGSFSGQTESADFLNGVLVVTGENGAIITAQGGQPSTLTIDGDNRQFTNGSIFTTLDSTSSPSSMATQAKALVDANTTGLSTSVVSSSILKIDSSAGDTFGNIIVSITGGSGSSAAANISSIVEGLGTGGSVNEQTELTFSNVSGNIFSSFADTTPANLDSGIRGLTFQITPTHPNGIYVAVGIPELQGSSTNGGVILTSTDGTNWTENTSGSPVIDKSLNDVSFGLIDDGMGTITEKWIAVADGTDPNGHLITATDPTGTWTEITGHGVPGNPQTIRFGNGLWVTTTFVQGGIGSTIMSSTDGVGAWSTETTSAPLPRGLEFVDGQDGANGLFVAVGNNGTINTSSGDTPGSMVWSAFSSGVTQTLYAVAFSDGLWMAVGSAGKITTSPNARNWTPRTSGTAQTLNGATAGGGSYFALGAGGTILTSTDRGENWSTVTSGPTTSNNMQVGFFGNGRIIFGATTNSGVRLLASSGTGTTFTINGDTSEFGASGSLSLDNFVSSSDGDSMASQAAIFLEANTTGLNISSLGNLVRVDSTTGGQRDPITVTPLIGGTASVTVTRQQVGVNAGSAALSAYAVTAFSPHDPASFTASFPSNTSASDALVIIRNLFIANPSIQIGGYTASAISGTTFSVTSTVAGAETDLTFVITSGTDGNLVTPFPTLVTTLGRDFDVQGDRDEWEVVINNGTPYTGTFDSQSSPLQQAQQIQAGISGDFTTEIVNGTLIITATENGNQPNTTAILTAVGATSTARGTDLTDPFPRVESTDGSAIPNWSSPVQDGFDGIIGLNGPIGDRGPGRYDRNFTKSDAGVLDEDTTKFNEAARCAVAGGFPFNASGTTVTCKENVDGSGSNIAFLTFIPEKGDIVVLTVTDSNDDVSTSAAIHDGSGILNTAWEAFAVQIDGSLLVSGSVVAASIRAGTITGTEVTLTPSDVGAGSASSSGERMVITSTEITIFDDSGVVRVILGELD